VDKGILKF